MAKVKDQVLPGSDESYIDSTGVIHYDADLIRHIMPNTYPLPTLNPTGVARETARNKRPSHQGPGSPDQAIQRRCFRTCVDIWYSLPRECPEAPMCQGLPSIENVWQQKVDQGVMCSYYDLFMSCCMSKCQADGSISGSLDCFDCPAIEEPPCIPGFTSSIMSFGESQDLSCVTYNDCCICADCTMSLISGGGELIYNDDGTWTYNSPDENPNCDNNPTLELCCGAYDCVPLTLSITSSVLHGAAAYQMIIVDCVESPPGFFLLSWIDRVYYCDGSAPADFPQSTPGSIDCLSIIGSIQDQFFGGTPAGAIYDIRSEKDLLMGCCPQFTE